MKKLKMPILDVQEIAKDTFEIRLEMLEEFDYKAGQYVSLVIDNDVHDGKGKMRSFSLSSSPENKEYISTCFRLPDKHSDFKEYLVNAPVGTFVEVSGPRGIFILPEDSKRSIVMIAGGVGITPFIGMIRDSTMRKTGHRITLLYTDKSEERMPYFDELVKLENKNKKFDFIHRLERVDKDFIEKHVDIKGPIFYICGTSELVDGIKALLKKMSVAKEDIKFENFTGY